MLSDLPLPHQFRQLFGQMSYLIQESDLTESELLACGCSPAVLKLLMEIRDCLVAETGPKCGECA